METNATMQNNFEIVSMVIFFFLSFVWTKREWYNLLAKLLLFVMGIWALSLILK
jgi:hypothetical protein